MSKERKTMRTKSYEQMREQVQRGRALLDRVRPGWQQVIRVDMLDLSSGSSCVLGQLFDGGFAQGVHDLFSINWFDPLPVTNEEYHLVADHGFVTSIDYSQLELIWKELLPQKEVQA